MPVILLCPGHLWGGLPKGEVSIQQFGIMSTSRAVLEEDGMWVGGEGSTEGEAIGSHRGGECLCPRA